MSLRYKVNDMVRGDQPVAPYRSLPSTLMSGCHRKAGLETLREKRPNAVSAGRAFENEGPSPPRHYAQVGDMDLRDGESRLPNFRGFIIKLLSLFDKKI